VNGLRDTAVIKGCIEVIYSATFSNGETAVSLSAICQLIVALLIVFVLTGIFKNFLKRRLLFRLGSDEGNREEIATIISYAVGTLEDDKNPLIWVRKWLKNLFCL
jgi:Kef-type K+ transport system membrane component KefB